jgi:hypothetical protein
MDVDSVYELLIANGIQAHDAEKIKGKCLDCVISIKL